MELEKQPGSPFGQETPQGRQGEALGGHSSVP